MNLESYRVDCETRGGALVSKEEHDTWEVNLDTSCFFRLFGALPSVDLPQTLFGDFAT